MNILGISGKCRGNTNNPDNLLAMMEENRNENEKNDAEFKIKTIKEYLAKKEEDPNLTKSDFAFEKKISDSTFNDSVLKYQKMGNEFANATTQIELLSNNVIQAPAIIKYEGGVHNNLVFVF